MTPEHQIEKIMNYCREILKAEGPQTKNTWEMYLWKIEHVARNLGMGIESGDVKVEK